MMIRYESPEGRVIFFSITDQKAKEFIEKFGPEGSGAKLFYCKEEEIKTDVKTDHNIHLMCGEYELIFKSKEDFDDFTVPQINTMHAELSPFSFNPPPGHVCIGVFTHTVLRYKTNVDDKIFDGYIENEDLKHDKAKILFQMLPTMNNYEFPIYYIKEMRDEIFALLEKRGHLSKAPASLLTLDNGSNTFHTREKAFNFFPSVHTTTLWDSKIKEIQKSIMSQSALFFLLVFDGIQTNISFREIAEREPNYFISLFNAFHYGMMHLHQSLDENMINKLHQLSTQRVGNLNPNSEKNIHLNGATLYWSEQALSGLDKNEVEKAFKEIVTDKYSSICFEENSEDSLDLNAKKYQENFKNKKGYAALIFSQSKDNSETRFYPVLDEYKEILEDSTALAVAMYKSFNVTTDEDVRNVVAEICNDYNTELALAGGDARKVRFAIANKVQRLERFHPFTDANCRTFCILLLNLELIKNGQNPTLQNDPNLFDILSLETLVNQIEMGQERYINFINGKDICYKNIVTNEEVTPDLWMESFDLFREHQMISTLALSSPVLIKDEALIEKNQSCPPI